MKLIIIIINIFFFTHIFAQNTSNDVLFNINNESISKDKFVMFLKKNGINIYNIDKTSLKAQLDNFISYKLKIKEAEKLGYNNTEQYKNKIKLYKEQLSKSYLSDKSTFNKLVNEAYNRLLVEIRVKHILVKLSPYSSKKDSVIAYNKAIKIKKRIVNGENFNLVAHETSDDHTAAVNGGDLWYITAFNQAYDFENYVYKAKKNSFIGPVKTKLGYHLIKIENRRKKFGSYKVAHILLNKIKNDTLKLVETKINSIYKVIKLKNNFSELVAKYSQDKSTNLKGGILPWFSTNQMPHEFEETTYALLKNGDISKPIKTKNAWHIIKLIDRKEIPSLRKIKEQIEHKVEKSDRYYLCEKKILQKIRKENNIKEYYSIYEIKSTIDSTIFEGKWKIPDSLAFNKILFSINNKKYIQSDFVKYLYENQKPIHGSSTDNYVDQKYQEYFNKTLIKLEEKKLEEKNQEFKNLVVEFSESILHREYVNNEILQKSKFDTKILKKYYSANKEKYNNTLHSNLLFLQYNSSVDAIKLEKYIKKYRKKGYTDEKLVEKLKKSLKSDIKIIKKGNFIEGNNKFADIVFLKFKQNQIDVTTKYVFFEKKNLVIFIKSKIKKYIKPFETIKEKLLIDYKTEIEIKNINKLKTKYNVKINETVLESLINLKKQ